MKSNHVVVDMRPHLTTLTDNRRAFRLCVWDWEDDRYRLLDASKWPRSVTVSKNGGVPKF